MTHAPTAHPSVLHSLSVPSSWCVVCLLLLHRYHDHALRSVYTSLWSPSLLRLPTGLVTLVLVLTPIMPPLLLARSLLTTTGHKLVGTAYWYVGYVGGLLGFTLSIWMRWSLVSNGLGLQRSISACSAYNAWITSHGLIMLFVFVMPQAIGGLGNYLLPLLLGSSELVLPRLNGLSLYMLVSGVVLYVYSQAGLLGTGTSSGWTLYAPLSTRDAGSLSIATDLLVFSVHLLGLSSTFGAINMLVTFVLARSGTDSLSSSNLFTWSIAITSLLLLGALPVLAVSVTGLLLDRNWCTTLYDGNAGGDPLLFQHLFWFFGHPEVYVIILPVFGLVSMVLGSISHTEVYGRLGMVHCMGAIGFVGYVVWAHHMFSVGLDLDTRAYFSAATALVGVPTSVKVFSWLATLSGSSTNRGSSVTYGVWCFLVCFTLGGFTGLVLSNAAIDVILHDTYFVVGHFHTVLSLGAVFGLQVAIAYVLTQLGWCTNDGLVITQLNYVLVGTLVVFGPMHTAGIHSMSRRVLESLDVWSGSIYTSTCGLFSVLVGVLVLTRQLVYTTSPSTLSLRSGLQLENITARTTSIKNSSAATVTPIVSQSLRPYSHLAKDN